MGNHSGVSMQLKNKEELLAFEEWCVETYKKGLLRSPIHLSGGNEEQLIEIFKVIRPTDWVISTYRSHYHALLKGIPEEWLKQWILENKSIHVMNKEHKFITSAIVAGTIPTALGLAMGIQRKQATEHVWVFIGDMTAHTGTFWEAINYARNHALPITFIIEDNKLSTDTRTEDVWEIYNQYFFKEILQKEFSTEYLQHYEYTRTRPHYGCGVFIDFPEDKKELVQDGKNF